MSGRRSGLYGLVLVAIGAACGSDGSATAPNGDPTNNNNVRFGDADGGPGTDSGLGDVTMYPELWYSADQLLVVISLSAADGTVASIKSSTITLHLDTGQSAITMLKDGSLLASRLSKVDHQTHFFYVPTPPRDGSNVTPVALGVMPNGIMLEGLYTDCEGRVYGMDTGSDDTDAKGNRLLRFTGNVVGGDFTFGVISDLATADVADIDDMGPGIDNNQVTDNPGFAIDTGNIHAFNYETGSGHQVAKGGTYGIHALGGPLFQDGRSRLYVLNGDAQLFQIDPVSFATSKVLGTGPTPAQGPPGWSSLAGPLTNCKTGFTRPPR